MAVALADGRVCLNGSAGNILYAVVDSDNTVFAENTIYSTREAAQTRLEELREALPCCDLRLVTFLRETKTLWNSGPHFDSFDRASQSRIRLFAFELQCYRLQRTYDSLKKLATWYTGDNQTALHHAICLLDELASQYEELYAPKPESGAESQPEQAAETVEAVAATNNP